MEDLEIYRMRVLSALRILKDRDPDRWSVIQSVLEQDEERERPKLQIIYAKKEV
jgi:hypothetical protein